MKEIRKPSNETWPADFESHRRLEAIEAARNSTVSQRFAALEEMWEMLRPQMPELIKNRWARIDREEAERIARLKKNDG